MFMDLEEPIRFRVLREVFTDKMPSRIDSAARRPSVQQDPDLQANSQRIAPYTLTCSIQDDGLGLVSWWGG